MGTSTSFRAPSQPRWSAFVSALVADAPVERIRSELFNAGQEWRDAIAAPAVASYAQSLVVLFDSLPERVGGERPDLAIGEIVAEARHASRDQGFSTAGPMAERAFARLLLSTLGGVADDRSGPALAERWGAARGPDSSDLAARYLGEVLGQYARHATDREAGRLIRSEHLAASTASLSQQLADRASEIGTRIGRETLSGGIDSQVWARSVAEAFQIGSRLPRGDS